MENSKKKLKAFVHMLVKAPSAVAHAVVEVAK